MSNERPNDPVPPEAAAASCSREELGLRADEIVFINAAPAEVIASETYEAWAQVLSFVPNSLLAVAPFAGREHREDEVTAFVDALEKVLAAHGVDDQRLIVFLRDLPTRADVRKYLGLGNVYLDVYPALDPQGVADAFENGLPVVVRQEKGEQPHSGTALLCERKLDELIAANADEFVAKAKRLAADAAFRREMTARLVAASTSNTSKATQAPSPRPQVSSDDPVWRGKRVMVYTDLPGIYGVGQYNHALLCELARRGAKAYCVQTKDDNPLVTERERLGVEHRWLSYHTRREFERTFSDIKDPKKIFKKVQPHLIVFSNCSPRSNLAAKRVAVQRGLPFVIAESYVPAELIALSQWTRECDTQLATQYRAARQVIAVSQDNLKLLLEQYGMPESKGVVVHYGRPATYFSPRDEVARKRLRTEFGIPEDAMLSLTAARLDPVKGYQYQLRALARLKESDAWSKLYFAWAGAGPAEADIREGVRRLDAADHVHVLGERHDIPDWLSAADCFVLTSKAEGMPICIMEAMAKGLPVAATSVSGTPEELGDTGRLLPDPNAAAADDVALALVEVLQDWARDPEARRAAGTRCRERAEKMFRVERMLAETLSVLADAIG